ncbi:MAG: tetratricopeptide repeat protein, partial [Caldilineaceae bacterium]
GAVSAFHRALDLLARAEAHVYGIQAYSYLSTTYWQMGDYENAFQCGQAALAICEAQHMPERRRFAWGDMGAAAAMLGQITAARQWLQDSLDLAQVVSDAPQEVFCRGHLGHLALSEGDFDEAERQLQAAYSLSRRADTVNYVSWLLRGLAEVAAVTGQAARAQVLAAEALSVAQANQQAGEVRAAQDLLAGFR